MEDLLQLYNTLTSLSPVDAIRSVISTVATMIRPLLEFIGIHLPAQGYIIVAIFVVSVVLYYMQKITVEILKAILMGVVAAVVLHMLGLI